MKKVISIFISLSILALIYWKIDLIKLVDIFRHCHTGWLALSFFMFVPLILLISKRLQILAPKIAHLSWAEALKLVLSASVLNLVLPSKMGDIAKAYFIAEKGYLSGSVSLSLMIYEKSCDMLSLMLWCIIGLIIYPQKNTFMLWLSISIISVFILGVLIIISQKFSNLFFTFLKRISPEFIGRKINTIGTAWAEMCHYVAQDRMLIFRVAGISIFIWFLHLVQIWFFILMLNYRVPFIEHLVLAPLSIFIGLLPLTFAGIGTRDAALIFFYKDYLTTSAAAALGILCTSRYLIPAVFGIPFFNDYLAKINYLKKQQISNGN